MAKRGWILERACPDAGASRTGGVLIGDIVEAVPPVRGRVPSLDHPSREVRASGIAEVEPIGADGAETHYPAVFVGIPAGAGDGLAAYALPERLPSVETARIQPTGAVGAALGSFRRVDPVQPDPRIGYLDRIAIDDAGEAGQRLGACRERGGEREQRGNGYGAGGDG